MLIYLTILIVGTSIPFLFCIANRTSLILDIIKTTSILATSIFALVYFDPFGLNKKRKEKQYENVIKIIESLVGQRIIFNYETSDPKSMYSKGFHQFFISSKNIAEKKNSVNAKGNEFLKFPLLFDFNNFIESNKDLTSLKYNIWTPKEIVPYMDFLDCRMTAVSTTKHGSFTEVYFGNQKKDFKPMSDIINNNNLTAIELIDKYDLLLKSCVSWLTANSFSEKELNI